MFLQYYIGNMDFYTLQWYLFVISAWALIVVDSTVQGKCESLEGRSTTRGSRFFCVYM